MSYCPNCGTFVEGQCNYCKNCGSRLTSTPVFQQPVYVQSPKDPMIALILALVPGLFGIWGIGHFYVGEIGKGILLLFLGIGLALVMLLSIVCALIILFVGFFIWLWQGYDAYTIAKDMQQPYRYY